MGAGITKESEVSRSRSDSVNMLRNACGDEGFDHWLFCGGKSIQNLKSRGAFKEAIESYQRSRVVYNTFTDWSTEWSNARCNWAIEKQQGAAETLLNENYEPMVNFATSFELGMLFFYFILNGVR